MRGVVVVVVCMCVCVWGGGVRVGVEGGEGCWWMGVWVGWCVHWRVYVKYIHICISLGIINHSFFLFYVFAFFLLLFCYFLLLFFPLCVCALFCILVPFVLMLAYLLAFNK